LTVDWDELVLLVHVHVVGGLHRHTLEGEAEAAGLQRLLVGGEDARGLVGVDGQEGFACASMLGTNVTGISISVNFLIC
jgi:hypothetical protein